MVTGAEAPAPGSIVAGEVRRQQRVHDAPVDSQRFADRVVARAAGEIDRGCRHILIAADPACGDRFRHLIAMVARCLVHPAGKGTGCDRGDVDEIVLKLQANGNRIRDLIKLVVQSHIFLTK